MATTAAPAPTTTFAVVIDGHVHTEPGWTIATVATRDEAVRLCDDTNRLGGIDGRTTCHIEQV